MIFIVPLRSVSHSFSYLGCQKALACFCWYTLSLIFYSTLLTRSFISLSLRSFLPHHCTAGPYLTSNFSPVETKSENEKRRKKNKFDKETLSRCLLSELPQSLCWLLLLQPSRRCLDSRPGNCSTMMLPRGKMLLPRLSVSTILTFCSCKFHHY